MPMLLADVGVRDSAVLLAVAEVFEMVMPELSPFDLPLPSFDDLVDVTVEILVPGNDVFTVIVVVLSPLDALAVDETLSFCLFLKSEVFPLLGDGALFLLSGDLRTESLIEFTSFMVI